MIPALIASIVVVIVTIITTISLIQHTVHFDLQHLKLDITFFVIGMISVIVIFHIVLMNRKEIFARN